MIRLLKDFFYPPIPTPLEVALGDLERHQRELVTAKQRAQEAAATVIYHERSIHELQRLVRNVGEAA